MVGVYEVDMVGCPAHHEDHDHNCEHLHDLLLVVPALGEGSLGHQQPQGGLVPTPQVASHLQGGQSGGGIIESNSLYMVIIKMC